MTYEPSCMEASSAIAARLGRCDRCRMSYRDCECEDEPGPEFDAEDEAVLPQHIAERIQAMRASKKDAA